MLGDSAENARYIETLTRRGYRWIAGAEWVTEPVSPESTIPVAIDRQKTRRGKDLLKRGCLVAAVAVLVLICTAVWSSPHLPKVTSAFQLTNDGKAKIDSNLFATDGVHLYFMEGTPWGGGSAIAQVSAIGGLYARLPRRFSENCSGPYSGRENGRGGKSQRPTFHRWSICLLAGLALHRMMSRS